MYHSLIVERAMELRNQQTEEECKLWYVFLNKYPLKIRRQYPLDYYVADFCCREARLVIEIDGIQHQIFENIKYDEKRSKYIESKNYKVVRFNNTDIRKRFDEVCFYIDLIIKERLKELGKEELIRKIEEDPFRLASKPLPPAIPGAGLLLTPLVEASRRCSPSLAISAVEQ